MSERAEGIRTRGGHRFEIAKPWEAVGRGVLGAVRELNSERWLVEVLAIGLIGLVIGLGALGGLAVMSTAVRLPAAADNVTRSDHDAEAPAIRAIDDSWRLRAHVATRATPPCMAMATERRSPSRRAHVELPDARTIEPRQRQEVSHES